MERICKPHLVDLLRYFDMKRIFIPRIRYASVRSKPELIRDLNQYFSVKVSNLVSGARLKWQVRVPHKFLPKIEYDLKQRHYLFDGRFFDIPKASRNIPTYSVLREQVTVHFPNVTGAPSTQTAVDVFLKSPEQETDGDSD